LGLPHARAAVISCDNIGVHIYLLIHCFMSGLSILKLAITLFVRRLLLNF
jgi:hypothetical protein